MEMPNQPTIKFYCFRKLSEYQRRLDGAKFGARWTPVNQNPNNRGGTFAVVLPYWVPAILFGFLAATGLRRWRKWALRSRTAPRLCAHCARSMPRVR
jgi:hypothetical protein